MKKIIIRLLLLTIISLSILVAYLSLVGVETKRFNSQISNNIKNINKNLEIELKEIKLILDPFKLSLNAKTLGPKIKIKGKVIEIESIKTKISINSFLNDEFSISNMSISTKSLEINNFLSFLRNLKQNPQIYILDKLIKKGYLVADIDLEFDKSGKVRDTYQIKGFVKDTKISLFKNYNVEKLNFIFDIKKDLYNFTDLKLSFNEIPLFSDKISLKDASNFFLVEGKIQNKKVNLDKKKINLLLKSQFFGEKLNDLTFKSINNFSFKIDKKIKIKDLKFSSEIDLERLSFAYDTKLRNFFPKYKKELNFLNHKIQLNFEKKVMSISGSGNFLIENLKDKINYNIINNNKKYDFDIEMILKENPLVINFLNYEKKENSKVNVNLKGSHFLNQKTEFNKISFKENLNKAILRNLILNKDYQIKSFKSFKLDYTDKENRVNKIKITKRKNDYFLEGDTFNSNSLIQNLIDNSEKKIDIFSKNIKLILKVKKVYLDNDYFVKNLNGNIFLRNNEINKADIEAFFTEDKKLSFTVRSNEDEKITTLFLDKAESIVRRYKFIKGYSGGSLDFNSLKKGKTSYSTLKIYDFRLKELPVLTKLLTLASLQGIADLLSGDGISFNEFEMNFENSNDLMTINEIYAIGPAISILMNGYVEKNKVVSLRGTLVPATTLNKTIGSIPFLGDILVGKKTGEGVFGVSFKIKGPPKNLETSVNPIKTLTPRFITRTLEKIKKN